MNLIVFYNNLEPLKLTILILIFFFIVFTLIKILIIRQIFYIIKEEYSFYFSKLNQGGLSFFEYLCSGKCMMLSYKIIFNPEYDFDDVVNQKKKIYVFVTMLYYLVLLLMIYLLYILYI